MGKLIWLEQKSYEKDKIKTRREICCSGIFEELWDVKNNVPAVVEAGSGNVVAN